jgi:hypothetical protein
MSPDILPADSEPKHNDTAGPKPVLSFHLLRGESLRIAATETRTDWLWKGYLAPGCMTMFTGQWKLGKTTLIALLLSRMGTGGELVGQAVRQGKSVVVSDENPDLWHLRVQQCDIGDQFGLLCRPFRGQPVLEEWLALIDYLVRLHDDEGLDLVVFDSLASFMPGGNENSAACMVATLSPLQRLTAIGVSVLIVHHPRRKQSGAGQVGRGSGVLPATVDILLEMDWYQRCDDDDRRRRLRAASRFRETPRRQVCEWTADGRDYQTLGDFKEDAFTQNWDVLRIVLEDAMRKLKRKEILEQWPPDYPRPDATSLWHWLEQGVSRGMIQRDGTGRRNAPFRYWLAEREEQWKKDPMYVFVEQEEKDREILRETLGEDFYGGGVWSERAR